MSIVIILLLAIPAFTQQPIYGQCGGIGWTGATTCVSGSTCTVMNEWYSQCIPGTATSTSSTTSSTSTSQPSSTDTGLSIRLLPLGDSITWGYTSSDGNGYRASLHTLLEPGNTVDFIGTYKGGSMADNDNEGHIGATIEQIASYATSSSAALPARPNVVLVMAGTNDIIQNLALSTAPTRLSALIDSIFKTCPDAAVIVATLTPLSASQAAVDAFNQAITTMVNTRTAAGEHILLASMPSVPLLDGIHPSDAGYVEMADAWHPVVQTAVANKWIGTPV